MIVYWYLAPNPPGEEKLSDVSTQQLHIKNSSLLDAGSCETNARSRSRMLEALTFLVPGMKGSSITVTGPIQCIHDCDHTTVCVCVCVYTCLSLSTHSNTGKQWLRKVYVKELVNHLSKISLKGPMGLFSSKLIHQETHKLKKARSIDKGILCTS